MINRYDILVMAIAAATIAGLFNATWLQRAWSQYALIQTSNAKPVLEPLSPDRTIRIEGKIGISVLEIHNHAIRFTRSPCSNKLCIQEGWLRHAGQSSACLPNRVSVRLTGPGRDYDAINF